MKNAKLYLALFSLLCIAACKQREEVSTESVETNTETITEVPNDTVVVKAVDEAPEGTAVKIDGDGISVDSKNGDKAVDVNVDVKK